METSLQGYMHAVKDMGIFHVCKISIIVINGDAKIQEEFRCD
jgi:hypothetical protein